jgi:hypothetical protein
MPGILRVLTTTFQVAGAGCESPGATSLLLDRARRFRGLSWGEGGAGVAGDGGGADPSNEAPPPRPHFARAVLPEEDITEGVVPNNQLLDSMRQTGS